MENETLISIVVVATPGRKKDLWRCLQSIKDSTYKNIETIVVDNSCNPVLAKEVKTSFPNMRLIRMPSNLGVLAYNIGFANAQGKYIVALDDDCTLRPDTLQKLMERFQQSPKNIGILDFNWFNPVENYYHVDLSEETKSSEKYSFGGGACMFKKKVFNKVGYYDADLFLWLHEVDLALRILDAGFKIYFAQDIVIDHYEEKGKLRKKKIFYNARNKTLLVIKHFSFRFFPLLILRDLVWIFLLPYRKGSLKALYYGIKGYITGWLNFWVPLKKRKVLSYKVQEKYIKSYLFGDLINLWHKISWTRK